MLTQVVLETDSDELREWTLQKFDPLLQSRTFYPHPHRMKHFWETTRVKFPHLREAINETAKLVREYWRMWDKLPVEEVVFDSYPLTSIKS